MWLFVIFVFFLFFGGTKSAFFFFFFGCKARTLQNNLRPQEDI